MPPELPEKTVKSWGLLANGSSGSWSIEVDEAFDTDEWTMQFDGPLTYLRFSLDDLQIVPKLLSYLRTRVHDGQANSRPRAEEDMDGLTLGRLGSMSVSIIQDDEFATRWFIIINGQADAVVRFTLDAADVEMLVEALRQVIEDLPLSE